MEDSPGLSFRRVKSWINLGAVIFSELHYLISEFYDNHELSM